MKTKKQTEQNRFISIALSKKGTFVSLTLGVLLIGFLSAAFFSLPGVFPVSYESQTLLSSVQNVSFSTTSTTKPTLQPLRMPTPESVRAIYMTQCVVGTPSFRSDLVKLIDTTEINAVVIDIKDYTGGLGFIPLSPELKTYLSTKCYAPDMREFVRSLNEKGIYVIGRVTVFQDPFYATLHPEFAIKKASATTTVWADHKGLNFIDVGAKDYWDYILAISREAYAIGFDELNYDYIRFPSDGNMKDIYYPFSEANIIKDPRNGKAEVLEEFFRYLHNGLRTIGVVSSADLFGMTTTNTDDLNIGQVLERALPYFDYIAPMVYPSHFPPTFNGFDNPNNHVYGVIHFSMGSGVERVVATTTTVKTLYNPIMLSTSTQLYAKEAYPSNKLRPWLQDFDYGGNYDVAEVKAQIQATYDVGLNSWMLWSPSNRYTVGALKPVAHLEKAE